MALSTKIQTPHYLLDEYKVYKTIDLTDDTEDKILSEILYGVEEYYKQAFGIYYQKEQKTDVFSVKNGIVVLPFMDVEIISAKLNGEDYDINDLYLIGNVLKSKTNGLTDGIMNFELTYNVGYDFENIPFDLKLALFIFTDKLYEKVDNNANLNSSITDPVGGRAVFVQKEIPKEVKVLLAPYSRVVI